MSNARNKKVSWSLASGTSKPQPAVVGVSVPAEGAYDLDKFQKVQQDRLGRLGCPRCTSGWDIFRSYMVDEKLNVQPRLQEVAYFRG